MIWASELMKKTGATHRQIDYWCRNDIIQTLGDQTPGSGRNRQFDQEIIPRVITLVKVSKALNGYPNIKLLKMIYEHFDTGFVALTEGITLSWIY
jgi:hypothetical protein